MITIITVSFIICLVITCVASHKEGRSRQWNIASLMACVSFVMCLSGQVVVDRCNFDSYVSTIRMEERLQHITNYQVSGTGAKSSDAFPSIGEVYSKVGQQ